MYYKTLIQEALILRKGVNLRRKTKRFILDTKSQKKDEF